MIRGNISSIGMNLFICIQQNGLKLQFYFFMKTTVLQNMASNHHPLKSNLN